MNRGFVLILLTGWMVMPLGEYDTEKQMGLSLIIGPSELQVQEFSFV